MSTKRVATGHNSGDHFIDPDTATDYVDRGPVAKRLQFDGAAVSRFYDVVRSHGNDDRRQITLSKLLERARANVALSHGAYRLLERIVYNARGAYRYSCEPQWALAHWCGFSGAKNLHRFLSELEDLGFIARIDMPREGGGHPFPIFSPVCTRDDRSGLGTELIAREGQKKRPQSSMLNSDALDTAFNASNIGHATPQDYGQTVDTNTVEKKERIMSPSLRERRRTSEGIEGRESAAGTSQMAARGCQNAVVAHSEEKKAELRARGQAAREVGDQVPQPSDWKPDDRIIETAVELGCLDFKRDEEGRWSSPRDDVDFFNREFEKFKKYNVRRVAEGHSPADEHFAWETYIAQRLKWGKWD